MDRAFETFETSREFADSKARRSASQVIKHLIEEGLGDGGRPFHIRVRERVSFGGNRTSDGREGTGELTHHVAEIVEAEAMRELAEEQSHDMTPVSEGAGVALGPVFPCQFVNQMGGNEIADLVKDAELSRG